MDIEQIKAEFEAATPEEQETVRGQVRQLMFDLWLKEAKLSQISSLVSEMKQRYSTFGEIRKAIGKGEYDWLLIRP